MLISLKIDFTIATSRFSHANSGMNRDTDRNHLASYDTSSDSLSSTSSSVSLPLYRAPRHRVITLQNLNKRQKRQIRIIPSEPSTAPPDATTFFIKEQESNIRNFIEAVFSLDRAENVQSSVAIDENTEVIVKMGHIYAQELWKTVADLLKQQISLLGKQLKDRLKDAANFTFDQAKETLEFFKRVFFLFTSAQKMVSSALSYLDLAYVRIKTGFANGINSYMILEFARYFDDTHFIKDMSLVINIIIQSSLSSTIIDNGLSAQVSQQFESSYHQVMEDYYFLRENLEKISPTASAKMAKILCQLEPSVVISLTSLLNQDEITAQDLVASIHDLVNFFRTRIISESVKPNYLTFSENKIRSMVAEKWKEKLCSNLADYLEESKLSNYEKIFYFFYEDSSRQFFSEKLSADLNLLLRNILTQQISSEVQIERISKIRKNLTKVSEQSFGFISEREKDVLNKMFRSSWNAFICDGDKMDYISKASEAYLDRILKDKSMDPSRVDSIIESVIYLFKYLSTYGKDNFVNRFKTSLNKRLLQDKAYFFEKEEEIINEIGKEMGAEHIESLSSMIADMKISETLSEAFKPKMRLINPKISFAAKILNEKNWPKPRDIEFTLPASLSSIQNSFTKFYKAYEPQNNPEKANYKNRKLTWAPVRHKFLLKVNLNQGAKQIFANTLQATILLLFDESPEDRKYTLSMKDIIQETNIPLPDLEGALTSLVYGKYNILLRLAPGSLEPIPKSVPYDKDDVYKVNLGLTSSKLRINLNLSIPNETPLGNVRDEGKLDMSLKMEASVVFCMKQNREMTSLELKSKVCEDLVKYVKNENEINLDDLDKIIDKMIEKGYIDRHHSSPSTYVYVP